MVERAGEELPAKATSLALWLSLGLTLLVSPIVCWGPPTTATPGCTRKPG